MSLTTELLGVVKEIQPYVRMLSGQKTDRLRLNLVKLFQYELVAMHKLNRIVQGLPTTQVKMNVAKLSRRLTDEEVAEWYRSFAATRAYLATMIRNRDDDRRIHLAAVDLMNANQEILAAIHKAAKLTRMTTDS